MDFSKRFVEKITGWTFYRTPLPRGVDIRRDIADLAGDQSIEVIFDVGAHHGRASLFFLHGFPQSRIFAFEPVASTYQMLETAVGGYPQISIHQLAFGAKPTEMTIHLQHHGALNSLVDEINQPDPHGGKTERIQIDTLDHFRTEHSIPFINILKIDTEGYDLQVIKGARHLLVSNLVQFLIMEVGFQPDNPRFVPFQTAHPSLSELGFSLAGFYYQGVGGRDAQLISCDALFVNHAFKAQFS